MNSLIDESVYRRFSEKKTAFNRVENDPDAPYFGKGIHDRVPEIVAEHREGYSIAEYQRSRAAWAVHSRLRHLFSEEWKSIARRGKEIDLVFEEKDPIAMSAFVKESGLQYGASLVGISELDRRWVYTHRGDGSLIDIPPEFRYAIVMATAMDAGLIRKSPAFTAATGVGTGYSRMAFLVCCMADFITRLGYRAIPMANDTALSIPLAIAAGMGSLGRNGMLLTEKFGACVRLCKVATDLPLVPDVPTDPPLCKTCESCQICVDDCQPGAISSERKPTFTVTCPSNNQGIKRWAVNADRCYGFWIENGDDCSNCIASCPLTPR